ncbi:MAG: hypothetical protein U0324_01360 [Polyangiales bacterium]
MRDEPPQRGLPRAEQQAEFDHHAAPSVDRRRVEPSAVDGEARRAERGRQREALTLAAEGDPVGGSDAPRVEALEGLLKRPQGLAPERAVVRPAVDGAAALVLQGALLARDPLRVAGGLAHAPQLHDAVVRDPPRPPQRRGAARDGRDAPLHRLERLEGGAHAFGHGGGLPLERRELPARDGALAAAVRQPEGAARVVEHGGRRVQGRGLVPGERANVAGEPGGIPTPREGDRLHPPQRLPPHGEGERDERGDEGDVGEHVAPEAGRPPSRRGAIGTEGAHAGDASVPPGGAPAEALLRGTS